MVVTELAAVPAVGVPLQPVLKVHTNVVLGLVVCVPVFVVVEVPQTLFIASTRYVCDALKDKPVVQVTAGLAVQVVLLEALGDSLQISIRILSVPFQKKGVLKVNVLTPETGW